MEQDHYSQLPFGSRALVTGATGFTGSLLVKKLVQQGVKVSAIARKTSNLKAFEDLPIHWLQGDVFDPDLIKEAVKDINYIFHMSTPFREAKSADVIYHNVHVLSTQQLAKAALQQPSFKRFIHVSTIGIHGHIENPPGDENSPFKPGDVYQETKLEGEIWIR
ncbi:MAG: NAD-dependent epimerase/dehydratase family protein, partial [Halothece sp. Uz-M2-17]|nr:NAD-dependent epimerase/dehydratase family protein [Halothece sp. Uz-M2-17]